MTYIFYILANSGANYHDLIRHVVEFKVITDNRKLRNVILITANLPHQKSNGSVNNKVNGFAMPLNDTQQNYSDSVGGLFGYDFDQDQR
jgi:hypothetical protein